MTERNKDRLFFMVGCVVVGGFSLLIVGGIKACSDAMEYEDGVKLGFNHVESYNPQTQELAYWFPCTNNNGGRHKCERTANLPDWCVYHYDPKATLVLVSRTSCIWYIPTSPDPPYPDS